MTIDISGLRTQPQPRPSLLAGDDDSGTAELAALRKDTSDSLADFNSERPTAEDLRPPSTPFVPIAERRKVRQVDPTRTDWRKGLDPVRPHHQLLKSPALAKAADELARKTDAVLAALDSYRDVDAEKTRATAEHVADVRAGDDATPPPLVDWEAVRAARLAVWQDRLAEAQTSARRYRSVLRSEATKRFPTVIETAAERRKTALAALKVIAEDVRAAVDASQAAPLFELELGLSGTEGWHRFSAADKAAHRDAGRAFDELIRYMSRTDPAITGAWVFDDDPSLPDHTRRALAAQLTGSSIARLILTTAEQVDERAGRPARSSYADPDADFDDLFATHHIETRKLPH